MREFAKSSCLKENKIDAAVCCKGYEGGFKYTKQIRLLARRFEQSEFIDDTDVDCLDELASEMLSVSNAALQRGDLKTAMDIAFTIIDEVTTAILFVYDDNIRCSISIAVEFLQSLTKNQMIDTFRKAMFNSAMQICYKSSCSDWHEQMIERSVELVDTDGEKEQIIRWLNKVPKTNSYNSDWEYRRAQGLHLKLIRKTESEANVIRYMEANIYNNTFRKELIELTFKTKEYAKVLKMEEEGMWNGSCMNINWREYMLNVYIEKRDKANIIKMAYDFFISSVEFNKKYYKLLKIVFQPQSGIHI